MTSMDPDPSRTPGLEPGGGVAPGTTPPETAQTSGLSAPEPDTRHRFPITGIAAIVVTAIVVGLFIVVAVALLVSLG
ncbi:hypothetical protein GV792_20465 [Nocardia cyriacigeorgica]|uniref:Uncharacterized protein n=1 Tax=Nocardia cyriacigeorgica TaxID=135487 RepID=A0A6P1D4H6_9NOCA|nr:DUF6480 family protein [Nocardia cyriacigeorgica]NEW39778.1 hypothetical protein [Nocardia cyriacigeorgica]NEW45505.1 hypothetical protein [Nocardia cyriacigeorgica]NEW52412.1 hypothetical protein [Nocardia cyriacigeorgica]